MKRCLRLLSLLLLLAVCSAAAASEYHGQVFFVGVPVPGAEVTVTQGDKHRLAVTDRQGLYEFPDLADGVWKIRIEMRGFLTLDVEVKIVAETPQGAWELKLLELDKLLAEAQTGKVVSEPLQPLAAEPAHSLSGELGKAPAKPEAGKSTAQKKDEPKPEETAAPPPQTPPDENAEKAADGLLVNGSENNAATSQFSLSPAFGNHRPGSKGLYNGGFSAIIDNSTLDARPDSLAGLDTPKSAYSRVTMGFTLGGPLNIPHLMWHGPNFFAAYQWTRNNDARGVPGLVPDAAQRSGQLAGLTIPVNPQAAALLDLYPLPNVTGNNGYNYQTEVLDNTHQDSLESRLGRTFGRRDQVYGGFGFRSTRADAVNLFKFVDATDTLGLDTNVNWSHRFRIPLTALMGYHLTRLRTAVRPEFENRENVSGAAGIEGNDQAPTDWGPPTLQFSSGIESLADAQSAFNRNRTDAASLTLSTNLRHHYFTYGGDFRRQEFNEFTQQNPRGVFTFNGAATGSDLEDFLSGIPDASTLAFGNADKYFRQSVSNAYFTDDWRLRPELTINAGMRWDYGTPLTELFGRLVNLDIAPGFTAAAPVVASSATGPLTGTKYPGSLVHPDRRGFEPRIGISWRPLPARTIVVRAGYGIYDDTSVYLSAAESMAQQAPLSTSVSVANSADCPLTLANGFRDCAGTTADAFALDPNLRVGYAQDWQLSVQSDLPKALVLNVTYLGIKGAHGMQEFLPNTYPIGASSLCPSCPVGFVYRTSSGNSTREAGQVQLRRRMRSGFTATINYTWAKAIDDDAQVGAQGHVVTGSSSSSAPSIAQNWRDLRAERGLSTFDQRNLIKAQLQYTPGMGSGGGTLLSGWRGRLLKEWTVMTQISAGSGLPETPQFLATVPGTGVTNTIRPDRTGTPIYQSSGNYHLNVAAYASPAAGQWGTARRDSITGPGLFSLDGSLSRTYRLRAPFNLDVRVDAANLLNHVSYAAWNTTLNWNSAASSTVLASPTFGLPAAANSMRSMQVTARLRF
jgi:hypothetical protein